MGGGQTPPLTGRLALPHPFEARLLRTQSLGVLRGALTRPLEGQNPARPPDMAGTPFAEGDAIDLGHAMAEVAEQVPLGRIPLPRAPRRRARRAPRGRHPHRPRPRDTIGTAAEGGGARRPHRRVPRGPNPTGPRPRSARHPAIRDGQPRRSRGARQAREAERTRGHRRGGRPSRRPRPRGTRRHRLPRPTRHGRTVGPRRALGTRGGPLKQPCGRLQRRVGPLGDMADPVIGLRPENPFGLPTIEGGRTAAGGRGGQGSESCLRLGVDAALAAATLTSGSAAPEAVATSLSDADGVENRLGRGGAFEATRELDEASDEHGPSSIARPPSKSDTLKTPETPSKQVDRDRPPLDPQIR